MSFTAAYMFPVTLWAHSTFAEEAVSISENLFRASGKKTERKHISWVTSTLRAIHLLPYAPLKAPVPPPIHFKRPPIPFHAPQSPSSPPHPPLEQSGGSGQEHTNPGP